VPFGRSLDAIDREIVEHIAIQIASDEFDDLVLEVGPLRDELVEGEMANDGDERARELRAKDRRELGQVRRARTADRAGVSREGATGGRASLR